MSKTTFINIGRLFQCRPWTEGFLKGREMASLPSMDQAFVTVEGQHIYAIGPMQQFEPESIDGKIIDFNGDWMLPGFIDSHTHIVYARSREQEFVQRIQGKSYEEIAASGGGILHSAKALAETPLEDLVESAYWRLCEITKTGTLAVEIKSGYGLSLESEIKMLKVIQELKNRWPGDIKATFLGAHAIPTEYKQNRQGYIDLIVQRMLPIITDENLADYVDVFCDHGFFTVEETEYILKNAASLGLKAKIHANELAISGGVQVGVKMGALSVDHLERIGDNEIQTLHNSTTIGTLLPNTSFFLGIPYAPARKMIDAGLGVALASDYNPGSAPSGSMLFVLALACIQMKMSPEEALNAVTINAAYAMELEKSTGSISIGKYANFLRIKPLNSIAEIPYYYTHNPIREIYIKGQLWP